MKQRVITGTFIALVYIAAIAGTIYVGNVVFDVFILFLMISAGWEMAKCIENKTSPTVKPFVFGTPVVAYCAFKITSVYFEVATAISAFIAAALFMCLFVFLLCVFSKRHTVSNSVSTMFVIVYPITVLSALLSLAYLPEAMFAGAVLIAFLSTSLADSMAYFVGSLLKGPKLCPNVSPKKTISGAIGGLLGGVIAGIVLFFLAQYNLLKISQFTDNVVANLLNWIFIGLGSALFCEIGDLLASHVKRVCGIKDFGNLLAGHGGIMDRIDGLMISSIYIYVYYAVLVLVL